MKKKTKGGKAAKAKRKKSRGKSYVCELCGAKFTKPEDGEPMNFAGRLGVVYKCPVCFEKHKTMHIEDIERAIIRLDAHEAYKVWVRDHQ